MQSHRDGAGSSPAPAAKRPGQSVGLPAFFYRASTHPGRATRPWCLPRSTAHIAGRPAESTFDMGTPESPQDRRDRFAVVAAEVFEPVQRYLRRRASADEAEEAFGDTLLALWRRLDDIPPDAVLPWSFGVARRVLANQRRSSLRRRRLTERISRLAPASFETDSGSAADHPELAAALTALREEDREVLRLWAWEQLEPREIATVLGITANAATLRLGKAKKRLSAAMAGQNAEGAGHIDIEHPRSAHE